MNYWYRRKDVEQGGEASESIAVDYEGEPMEIGYNAGYVIDILKQVDTSGSGVRIRISDIGRYCQTYRTE